MRRRHALVPAAVLASALLLASCGGQSHPGASASKAAPGAAVARHHGPTRPACPLTGAPAQGTQKVTRAPLAVKIDNVSDALPQAGLNSADIVFEELVEGGLTRLMAVFQCGLPATVGPIRSARISDADLLALFHGSVLGYSGANPKDIPPIQAHGQTVLISNDALGQYFHRDSSRAAPHNVFASPATLLAAGLARHKGGIKAPAPLFHYNAHATTGRKARHLSLSWPAASAAWTFAHGRYLRTQNGAPDRVVGGQQVTASNVVVMSVTIGSTGLRDVLGNVSPLDETVGKNPVWVMRGGKLLKGTWKRPSVTAGISLVDHHGRPIQLHPGRTWVELLPAGSAPRVG